nr:type III pantothenate kinase [Marinomonas algarum]
MIVDAGNTHIKLTAFKGDNVLWVKRCQDDSVVNSTMGGFVPQAIYLASVRSEVQSIALHTELQTLFPHVKSLRLMTQAMACGVHNAYVEPARLGVDRWLGVIGAHHCIQGGAVVVDAGTAIKVDVVNDAGVHLGGYIVPGLSMMESALLSNTARIRYDDTEVVSGHGLPDSTARAVTEGCYEMALGFLERVYRQYSDFTWVVTGGDGQSLLEHLGIPALCEPHLIAIGAKWMGNECMREGQ